MFPQDQAGKIQEAPLDDRKWETLYVPPRLERGSLRANVRAVARALSFEDCKDAER